MLLRDPRGLSRCGGAKGGAFKLLRGRMVLASRTRLGVEARTRMLIIRALRAREGLTGQMGGDKPILTPLRFSLVLYLVSEPPLEDGNGLSNLKNNHGKTLNGNDPPCSNPVNTVVLGGQILLLICAVLAPRLHVRHQDIGAGGQERDALGRPALHHQLERRPRDEEGKAAHRAELERRIGVMGVGKTYIEDFDDDCLQSFFLLLPNSGRDSVAELKPLSSKGYPSELRSAMCLFNYGLNYNNTEIASIERFCDLVPNRTKSQKSFARASVCARVSNADEGVGVMGKVEEDSEGGVVGGGEGKFSKDGVGSEEEREKNTRHTLLRPDLEGVERHEFVAKKAFQRVGVVLSEGGCDGRRLNGGRGEGSKGGS
ncbi:hypothetical protein EDB85DRAFT_2279557 [Lactarius pseudohatsudake]|nr:hypothetical protein EDB85DRAFT_2279557 [Lactarius pseudohatsudake]